jgi:hypothetical protein
LRVCARVLACAQGLAAATAIATITLFSLIYHAATTQFTTWKLGWAPSPCSSVPPPVGHISFAMHIFFMALTFGFFAPLGAVAFVLVRDTLGLSQNVAKTVHGFIQFGAFLCSVLGYVQIYYAHGASCSPNHFQSVHSYCGIVVLALFWWQFPSALAVFSNTTLAPPGSTARKTFLKYHQFVGLFAIFAGLSTLITGILILTGKSSTMPPPQDDIWRMYARAAAVAFVTIFLLALTLFESKAVPITSKTAAEHVNNGLLAANVDDTEGQPRH